jgi:hypothetical protein
MCLRWLECERSTHHAVPCISACAHSLPPAYLYFNGTSGDSSGSDASSRSVTLPLVPACARVREGWKNRTSPLHTTLSRRYLVADDTIIRCARVVVVKVFVVIIVGHACSGVAGVGECTRTDAHTRTQQRIPGDSARIAGDCGRNASVGTLIVCVLVPTDDEGEAGTESCEGDLSSLCLYACGVSALVHGHSAHKTVTHTPNVTHHSATVSLHRSATVPFLGTNRRTCTRAGVSTSNAHAAHTHAPRQAARRAASRCTPALASVRARECMRDTARTRTHIQHSTLTLASKLSSSSARDTARRSYIRWCAVEYDNTDEIALDSVETAKGCSCMQPHVH